MKRRKPNTCQRLAAIGAVRRRLRPEGLDIEPGDEGRPHFGLIINGEPYRVVDARRASRPPREVTDAWVFDGLLALGVPC